jgi:hypothetical protein
LVYFSYFEEQLDWNCYFYFCTKIENGKTLEQNYISFEI